MKAPPHRTSGKQRLVVNEEQARILRAMGWTEEDPPEAQEISPEPLKNEQNFFRSPPKEKREKRKYTRRDMSDRPKRRYRRRDMIPEDD